MYIKEIEWIDIESQEAVLKVVNGSQSLMCFSCPCAHSIGDILIEPLECIDTEDVVLCEEKEDGIEKIEGMFKYKLKGKLKDREEGILETYGFSLHINKDRIPGDIIEGEYIQFTSSRIDIW